MATTKRRQAPARTPEEREKQLISEAVDLAERQILSGNASPSVIVHYLKLGSQRQQLEMEKIRHETKLLSVKSEQIESQKRVEELYSQAVKAMRDYSGEVQDGSDET